MELQHGTFKSYLTGFILSVALTLAAYFVVIEHLLPRWMLITTIVGLAILQMMAQLYYFLHLGEEAKPRWNALVFAFMALVIVIVVFGSLWIMNNLAYNTMSP